MGNKVNRQVGVFAIIATSLWLSGLIGVADLNGKFKLRQNLKVGENVLTSQLNSVNEPTGCPSHFGIGKDIGRFGNKFFKYLTSRLIMNALDGQIFISRSFADIYDKYFNGRQTAIIDWNYMQYKCGIIQSNCSILNINQFPDLTPLPNITSKCIEFKGVPADITSKQWETVYAKREELIKEFQWKPDLKKLVDRKLNQVKITHNTSTVVAVHARRTDYFNYIVGYYGAFRPANASYYIKAMDYFRAKFGNPAFLVFSDDMKWCHANLNGSDVTFSGNGDQDDPGYDLALMSSCDHIILSYGTFGMTAAWFNNHGEIISADNFSGRPERMVEALKKIPSLNWKWTTV